MAVNLGNGFFTVAMQDNLSGKMQNLQAKLGNASRAIGRGFTVMGAAITGALTASILNWAKAGDAVQKLALKTGFSTEALSELRHAAELSGADLGTLEKAVKKMAVTIFESGKESKRASEAMTEAIEKQRAKVAELEQQYMASGGATAGLAEKLAKASNELVKMTLAQEEGADIAGTYTEDLEFLGLSFEKLNGLKPEEQFFTIANALADVEDVTMRAAIAQKVFGRAGTELLPMLAAGSEGIREMRNEAHELGIVFDQEAADKAAKFTDDMDRLKKALQGVGFAISDTLIEDILKLVDKMEQAALKASRWMKENPELTASIAGLAAKAGLLLGVVGPLLVMLPGMTIVFKAIRGAALLLARTVGGKLLMVIWALRLAFNSARKEIAANWDNIVKLFRDGAILIGDYIKAVKTFLFEDWGAGIDFIVEKVKGLINTLKAIPAEILDGILALGGFAPQFGIGAQGISAGAAVRASQAMAGGAALAGAGGLTIQGPIVSGVTLHTEGDVDNLLSILGDELRRRLVSRGQNSEGL